MELLCKISTGGFHSAWLRVILFGMYKSCPTTNVISRRIGQFSHVIRLAWTGYFLCHSAVVNILEMTEPGFLHPYKDGSGWVSSLCRPGEPHLALQRTQRSSADSSPAGTELRLGCWCIACDLKFTWTAVEIVIMQYYLPESICPSYVNSELFSKSISLL